MTSRVLSVEAPSSSSAAAAAVALMCRDFKLLKKATKNFDKSLKLGSGGFGKVYKATLIDSVTNDFLVYVAIKRGKSYTSESIKQYSAEVDLLSKLSHKNVVSLIGYRNDEVNRELILVYEYMYNGTLHDRLHSPNGRPPLTWLRRLKICVGAAHGLNYLHAGTHFTDGIVHRDMKSQNLLLDRVFEAKICDLGIAKTGLPDMTSYHARGSYGYLDPDYIATNIPTQKSDVYAFGVIMFEILSGKEALDRAFAEIDKCLLSRIALRYYREGKIHEIVDSNIKDTISSKCLQKFAKLASRCLDDDPNMRPTMAKVVSRLRSILVLQEKTILSMKSVGVTALKSMGIHPKKEKAESLVSYLKTVGGENRTLYQFEFETVNDATANFFEANRIFRSYFGSMYKGKLPTGRDIAIVSGHCAGEVYKNQISTLVKLEHENVIQLLGYCVKETMIYLLFDCAPYASLESLIFDPNCSLDWEKRYKILLGVGQAILYLHMHAPVQVIDIAVTPCDIILDESWNPKLSGYCFVASRVPDASGQIEPSKDPWIRDSREQRYLSTDTTRSIKSDVFSYGVLILETITGRHRKYPCNELLEDVVGHNLLQGAISDIIVTKSEGDLSLIERYLMVGVLCTQEEAADRPTMETVVEMLLGNSVASDDLLLDIRALNVKKWKKKVRDIKRAQELNIPEGVT